MLFSPVEYTMYKLVMNEMLLNIKNVYCNIFNYIDHNIGVKYVQEYQNIMRILCSSYIVQ
jgi:hypothetical protein